MNSPAPIINMAGDSNEAIQHYANYLGTDKLRRTIFQLIYGRGTKALSKKQIMEKASIPASKSQQVQNALEHLAKYHLIQKTKNEGLVDDGSRNLYAKSEAIRPYKNDIVKYADNRVARANIPTKRNRVVTGKPVFVVKANRAARSTKPKAAAHSPKTKIAFLTANPVFEPKDKGPWSLAVGAEYREVERVRLQSARRDDFEVKHFPDPDDRSLFEIINEYRPDIVHFSGHGSPTDLLFANNSPDDIDGISIDFGIVKKVFAATSTPPKMLVLNACNSAAGASLFLPVVPIFVGMKIPIGDSAAAYFSKMFYGALFAGQPVSNAFDQAKAFLEIGTSEFDTPELQARTGYNPVEIKF